MVFSIQISLTKKIVIIADDLTGALDAAAPLCVAGRSAVVATNVSDFAKAFAQGHAITGVSTRSRDLDEIEAGRRVREIVAQAGSDVLIFKKIDSRLKGPLSGEIASLPEGPLAVLPALAEFGRIVSNGAVSGFGVENAIDIRSKLGERGAGAMIPDTRTEAEMDLALAAVSQDAQLVGARGLALALSRALGGTTEIVPDLHGDIAIAVGSNDPITIEQVETLQRVGVQIFAAPNGKYSNEKTKPGSLCLQVVPGPHSEGETDVATSFAESFTPFASHCSNLVLTGGATAESILDRLDIGILSLEGEILPGLPLSRGGKWRIVTKSGGFGEADTLAKLLGVAGG